MGVMFGLREFSSSRCRFRRGKELGTRVFKFFRQSGGSRRSLPMRNKLQLVTQPKETSHDKLAEARLPSHGYGYGSDYFPE